MASSFTHEPMGGSGRSFDGSVSGHRFQAGGLAVLKLKTNDGHGYRARGLAGDPGWSAISLVGSAGLIRL